MNKPFLPAQLAGRHEMTIGVGGITVFPHDKAVAARTKKSGAHSRSKKRKRS